ncbi:MAG: hypothetical protein IMZ61_02605 [Planctomycetes bacterium]|nr:hypothetical protein [Planctomycetota bacterium]
MNKPQDALTTTKSTALKLLVYCRANNWAGYDPYDALNSRVFKALPFLNFRLARLALTQSVKRCPINLRPLLLVPKTPNPKGIALFLSSLVRLSKSGLADGTESIGPLADKLLALRSPGRPYSCWGYNFDWQQRTDLVPKGSPNIICSTFAGNALLDAYELKPEPDWLGAARSAADFILDVLFWREGASKACFSYTLVGRDEVHNANLLGAAFLCRVGRISGDTKYLGPALDAARYSAGRQHGDGSWDYGEAPTQRWTDNFHTGFNLVALRRIGEYGGTTEFESSIRRGFDFYRAHFFREDGAPRYFHNATYPIDIHSVAQSLITLAEFHDLGEKNIDPAHAVLGWALDNMWDERGFFYFQKRPHFTVRTPFMRWSQAWMLLALATLWTQESIHA